MKKLKKWLPIIILGIVFVVLFFYWENKIFSIHFVDEEENLVIGSFLTKGEKLYSDIFVQHQPAAYVISSWVQKLTNPNSIYLLIKRHREFILLWSFVWAFLLTKKHRYPLLFFVLTFEISKFYLLGNMFLAESLVIYPLIYLALSTISLSEKTSGWTLFFTGLVFALCAMLLLPVWPLLLFFGFIVLLKLVKNPWKILPLIAGSFLIFLIMIPYVSIKDYVFNTLYYNYIYYISDELVGSKINLLDSLFTPVISLFLERESSVTLSITKMFSLAFVLAVISQVIKKNYKVGFIVVVALGLANFRFYLPGSELYLGFHLISWFAFLILFSYYLLLQLHFTYKNKTFGFAPFLLATLTIFIVANDFSVSDTDRDYYVNYSRQFDLGEAVRLAKEEEDRLFVVPDEFLIYWQGQIGHASNHVYYYPYMIDDDFINTKIENMFLYSPPVFFYCNCQGQPMEKYLFQYTRFFKNGAPTDLYMLTSRAKEIDNGKTENLKHYDFEL